MDSRQTGADRLRTGVWAGYAVAVGGTALAAVVRWAIARWVGEIPPFITFYPVVMAAAVLSGTGAGVLASVLGALAADWLFMPPIGSLWPIAPGQGAGLVLFTAINVLISIVGGRLRTAYWQVHEGERQLRTLADSMPNLAWWANPDGYITWYNRRWYEYTGTSFKQMEGWGWQAVHDPKVLPTVLEHWKKSIATGEAFAMEFPLRGADGNFRWFLTRVIPVRDATGKVLRWFGTNTDVSEAREAREVLARSKQELERLVAERTTKLQETVQELEGFSYSLVHDMRAPLRAMQQFSELAQESFVDCARPKGQDYLRRIKTAANRLDQLITDALNYSDLMRESLPLTRIDVGKLLHGIIETYPNLQPPAVSIHVEFDSLMLLGNQSLLTQVFSNGLGNAVKFMAPGVKPRVNVRAEVQAECVRIWVEDNGIGIPSAAHQKIFNMFERLHRADEYPGTGIGLAIVRKAAERMGGRVGVESEPGKGSRFWFELPKPVDSAATAT